LHHCWMPLFCQRGLFWNLFQAFHLQARQRQDAFFPDALASKGGFKNNLQDVL
jgi:hypothetical protein